MSEDTNSLTEIAREFANLRSQVADLEKEMAKLEQRMTGANVSPSGADTELREQLAGLQGRLKEVEAENRNFAETCVSVQEQNEALTNLYVASHRLHATLDPAEVMRIITDILIEMVGAEEFGLFLVDENAATLQLVAGEGISERLPSQSLPAGEGVVGEVASTGEPFFFNPNTAAEQEVGLPLATVPLNMNGNTVGVVVIYKLFTQKSGFSKIDHQLLELVGVHAATALVSARLHTTRDRKLKTLEGFVELMKPN